MIKNSKTTIIVKKIKKIIVIKNKENNSNKNKEKQFYTLNGQNI